MGEGGGRSRDGEHGGGGRDRAVAEPGVRGDVYETRFGPTGRDLYQIPLGLFAIAAGVYIARTNAGLGVFIAGLCGLLLLWKASTLIRRRTALRVDAEGITLGMAPPWPAAYTATVPWGDITGVVLWTQDLGRGKVRHIGLSRVDGAPDLIGSTGGPLADAPAAEIPAGVPRNVAADSRPVAGWRLDAEALRAAVAAHGRGVAVRELG